MNFRSFFIISGNGFLLNPKIHMALIATLTPLLHLGSTQRDRQAGPWVKATPPISEAEPERR
jgi:hypothetical protein